MYDREELIQQTLDAYSAEALELAGVATRDVIYGAMLAKYLRILVVNVESETEFRVRQELVPELRRSVVQEVVEFIKLHPEALSDVDTFAKAMENM